MSVISFSGDIVPMFRPQDVTCMRGFNVLLSAYDYMSDPSADPDYPDHANARHVLARLEGAETPRMPKGGPFWSQAMLSKYKTWMEGGYQP